MKVAEERERLIELLSKVVGELRGGRYDSLVAHVEAEREAQARVASIVAREKQCAARVSELAEGASSLNSTLCDNTLDNNTLCCMLTLRSEVSSCVCGVRVCGVRVCVCVPHR